MKKYGLIGKKLNYSYSKIIHDFLIAEYSVNATYDLIELESINKDILLEYDGLNVTIPYKEEVLQYLDDNIAKMPVNTIMKIHTQLIGYNTDIDGFEYLVKNIKIADINKVVILGSGASSKMIQAYFKDKEVIVVSRDDKVNNYQNLKNLHADLLINTTPIGVNEYASPINEEYLTNFHGIIDLNYNPINSKLALDCRKNDINFIGGLDMLLKQAVKSFQIWHGFIVDNNTYQRLKAHVLSQTQPKIALIGLSLSGKTTIIKKYHGVDLDEEIESKYQENITNMLENNVFRERETIILKELVNGNKKLVACGGGIVLKHENMELLKDYLIIHLTADIETLKERLSNEKRPLIQDEKQLIEMNNERQKLYKKYANIELNQEELEGFLNETSNH